MIRTLSMLLVLSATAGGELGTKIAALEAAPESDSAFDALHRALADPEASASDETRRGRALLRKLSRRAADWVSPPGEPGTPLVVSGTVRDAEGKAVAGALLIVFQADADGLYTKANVMDERNARLFAFLRTGLDGRFELRTVRPGGYPPRPGQEKDEKWLIPAHIHIEVATAEGGRDEAVVRRRFQLVFDDDPRLTPYWREWAARDRNPIVSPARDESGALRATLDIQT